MPELITHVAGINFRLKADPALADLRPDQGDEVKLVSDPNNEFDHKAVKVILGDKFIGFLPKGSEAQKLHHEGRLVSAKVEDYQCYTCDGNGEIVWGYKGTLGSVKLRLESI